MTWIVEFLNDEVQAEIDALPKDMRGQFGRIANMIETLGLQHVHAPQIKHVKGDIWEMRMKGRDGISRALYVTKSGKRVIIVRAFIKKTQKTPSREINLALKRMKEIDQ